MQKLVYLSHLYQHLYIGGGPLLLPLVMRDLNLTYILIGFIISIRTFFAAFCQVFYGYLKFNRKIILSSSNLFCSLSSFGMGISSFLSFIFFNGLWGLSTSPLHPFVSSLMEKDGNKGRFNIGLFYSYGYLGNLLGALLVTLLIGYIGWRSIFFIMGIIGLPLFFLCSYNKVSINNSNHRFVLNELKMSLSDKRVVLMCLLGIFLFGCSNIFIRHMMPLYLVSQLKIAQSQVNLIFLFILVIGILSPYIFIWISNKIEKKALIKFLALSLSALFFYLPNLSHLTLTIILLYLTAFLGWPLLSLLHAYTFSLAQSSIKASSAELFLSVSICSFIPLASLFGYLIDLTKSFNWMFYLTCTSCIISIFIIGFIKEKR